MHVRGAIYELQYHVEVVEDGASWQMSQTFLISLQTLHALEVDE